MADERTFADAGSLRPVVRAALGRGRALVGAERLAGGSKKGAYRLTMDDGGTALLYAWNDSEDYWQGVLPAGADDPADPFSHASGLALFEAAARALAAAGVRCPEILFTDRSGDLYPADIAVVEDVPGGSLEALLDEDPGAAERPLSVLADWLAGLAAVRSPSFGKVAFVDAAGRSAGTSCERVMLDRALAQLREIAGRDRRAADAQGRLEETLHSLAEPIEPRVTWALVHGELGPDHVLLDRRGEPVLIDIEGARYFDVETEHVWTRMRFGGHYPKLSPGGLDEDRLRLYQLCMHLDLVAGPLRIAGTSHPERAWFRGVAEHHLQRALQFPALTARSSAGAWTRIGRRLGGAAGSEAPVGATVLPGHFLHALGRVAADRATAIANQMWWHGHNGHATQMALRPQTIAHALNDSPAGQPAWNPEWSAGPSTRQAATSPPYRPPPNSSPTSASSIDWEAAISALQADDPRPFPAIHYSPHPRRSHYVTMHEVLDPERADQVLRAAYPDERQRDYAMRWLGWIAFHMGADERLDWWAIPAWMPPAQLVTARRLAAWAILTAAAGLAIAATVQAAILFGIVGWIAAVQAFLATTAIGARRWSCSRG